jgi:predicted nucleic acid-binding protein
MIVLDASAAVGWLLQTSAGQNIEKRIYSRNETLHAPHLLDVEVAQILRRLALQGVVSVHRAAEAVSGLLDLVLAETLGAMSVTRDVRLASASVHAASVELF